MRNYKRKSDNEPTQLDVLLIAAKQIKLHDKSIRGTAKNFGIPESSLRRFCKKTTDEELLQTDNPQIRNVNKHSRQILSQEAELKLVKHLLDCNDDMYFDITPKEVRELAFDLAEKLEINVPSSWKKTKMAGQDWLSGFLKRHSELSLWKSEATSLARATSSNRTNGSAFFHKLKLLMDRYHFSPKNIYNMDEIGVTTDQTSNRVLGRPGAKQIGSIDSSERGTLVTIALAVSTTGNLVPPFFFFPRKKFKNHFLNGGPNGSAGGSNPSGWMNAENFLQFITFFQSNVRASVDDPVLLILDNHKLHLSISGLDYCKENGIVVLSLPPDCSHKVQPLERTVFETFKKAVNIQCDSWCTNNPGKTMSICDIPEIIKLALPISATNNNITSEFQCTGISPFNPDIFEGIHFMSSNVTDLEAPTTSTSDVLNNSALSIATFETIDDQPPGTSTAHQSHNVNQDSSIDNVSNGFLNASLENVHPLPKAAPNKSRRGRKRRRTKIL